MCRLGDDFDQVVWLKNLEHYGVTNTTREKQLEALKFTQGNVEHAINAIVDLVWEPPQPAGIHTHENEPNPEPGPALDRA